MNGAPKPAGIVPPVLGIVSIIAASYLACGLFYAPVLHSDDWSFVLERPVMNTASWADLTQGRLLIFVPLLLQNRLCGVNVPMYHAVLGCLHALCAVLIYLIAARFWSAWSRSFCLAVAVLFLVYPTTYTGMWLTLTPAYSALCLTLLYAFSLLITAQRFRWAPLLAALGCLLAGCLIYEAGLGLACAWVAILFMTYPQRTGRRWVVLLSTIAALGAFVVYRTVGQVALGVHDTYRSEIDVDPAVLAFRLAQGFKVSLAWGWTTTLRYLMPWLPGNKTALLLLAVATVGCWWVTRWLLGSRDLGAQSRSMPQLRDRWPLIRPFAFSTLWGLVLIGAGYVPVIVRFLPTLQNLGSRFNLFASLGSALTVASVLMVGSLLFARHAQQGSVLFLSSIFAFVALGVTTQAYVQRDARRAWREQQAIWQQLFREAPDFKDGTFVLFVLPGFQDRVGYQNWQRTPLDASWAVRGALRLLYANPTLAGDVLFPDLAEFVEPELTPGGILTWENGVVTPYDRTVAFIYDEAGGTLRPLPTLPPDFVRGAAAPIELCSDCVIPARRAAPALRRLVER